MFSLDFKHLWFEWSEACCVNAADTQLQFRIRCSIRHANVSLSFLCLFLIWSVCRSEFPLPDSSETEDPWSSRERRLERSRGLPFPRTHRHLLRQLLCHRSPHWLQDLQTGVWDSTVVLKVSYFKESSAHNPSLVNFYLLGIWIQGKGVQHHCSRACWRWRHTSKKEEEETQACS